MWTLRSHSSPPWIVAKPSFSCALPLRSDLTSVPGQHDPALDALEQVEAVRGVAVGGDVARSDLLLGLGHPPTVAPGAAAGRAAPMPTRGRRGRARRRCSRTRTRDRVAQADRAAGAGALEDRPLLVELPPLHARRARRADAAAAASLRSRRRTRRTRRRRSHRRPRPPRHARAASRSSRKQRAMSSAARSMSTASRSRSERPLSELAELRSRRAGLAGADRPQQRAVADDVGVASDRRGEVAVARRAKPRVADVVRRVVGLLERAQDERAEGAAAAAACAHVAVNTLRDHPDQRAGLRG